jgi:SAM-dependent methyltransferase
MATSTVRPVPLPAYADRAVDYAHDTAAFQHWRDELVAMLPLRGGDTVLDVGCGSGLCLPGLRAKVGPTGRVIGIDAAPAMVELARAEADRRGWCNVTLLAESAEDVLMSPAALDNIVAQLRPGAWVVAGGGKWPAAWNIPLTMTVASLHAPYVRDLAGFDRPWQLLERRLDGLVVTSVAFGSGFQAIGRVRR